MLLLFLFVGSAWAVVAVCGCSFMYVLSCLSIAVWCVLFGLLVFCCNRCCCCVCCWFVGVVGVVVAVYCFSLYICVKLFVYCCVVFLVLFYLLFGVHVVAVACVVAFVVVVGAAVAPCCCSFYICVQLFEYCCVVCLVWFTCCSL